MAATGAGPAPAPSFRYAPLLVSAAMVMLLGWQGAQFIGTVIGAGHAPAAQLAGSSPLQGAPSGPSFDVGLIVNAHLFGMAGATDTGDTDPNAVAATQLNLVLTGTIADADPLKGFAIIGDSAATARVYAVGRVIAGGAKLHSVFPDRVILDRNGRLEALLLPMKFVRAGAGLPPIAGGTAPDTMLGEPSQDIDAQNPPAIVDIIRPEPVFMNGRQRGYRVRPGRDRDQLSRLGLMPGDILTAVSDTPLDDPARGMEVLKSLDSVAQVAVTVDRNGQSVRVTIDNTIDWDQSALAETTPLPIPVTEAVEPAENVEPADNAAPTD